MSTFGAEAANLKILEQEAIPTGVFYRLQIGEDESQQADVEVDGETAIVDFFGSLACSAVREFVLRRHPDAVVIINP